MKYVAIAAVAVCFLFVDQANAQATARATTLPTTRPRFRLFDATFRQGNDPPKPNLAAMGYEPCAWITSPFAFYSTHFILKRNPDGSIVRPAPDQPGGRDSLPINMADADRLAGYINSGRSWRVQYADGWWGTATVIPKDALLLLDFEWAMKTERVPEIVEYLRRIRAQTHGRTIGFYPFDGKIIDVEDRVPPEWGGYTLGNDRDWLGKHIPMKSQLHWFRQEVYDNLIKKQRDRAKPITALVDYFSNDVYPTGRVTFERDKTWIRAATAETRGDTGKPVYLLIRGDFFPPEHMTDAEAESYLRAIYDSGADGVILWGGTAEFGRGRYEQYARLAKEWNEKAKQ